MSLRYKIGDKVKIKSLDWYNENKDRYGHVNRNGISFTDYMKKTLWESAYNL